MGAPADLFEWSKRPRLLVVDYYSRYPEVAQLRDMRAKTVISKMKSFFSRHGIPDEVMSDNGPNYASHEFVEFANSYGFVHTTTSPRYPQAEESGEDVYLALLDYRNTPIDGISPAQALMDRTLKPTIPAAPQHLKPVLVDHESFIARRETQQKKQCAYYNRTAQFLPPLKENEVVRIKKTPDSEWEPAKVVEQHGTPRSYIVTTEDGTAYRRNRRHLWKTSGDTPQANKEEKTDDHTDDVIPENKEADDKPESLRQGQPQPAARMSSFGRIIKPNPKYL